MVEGVLGCQIGTTARLLILLHAVERIEHGIQIELVVVRRLGNIGQFAGC